MAVPPRRSARSTGAPTTAPALSSACGRHFSFRDLIECGETWQQLAAEGSCDNSPRQDETWKGLERLCVELLDPLVEEFGTLRLTYAFASPALTRRISARIAPELDQHAGAERNRADRLVCSRRGQAVDFVAPGHTSQEVARWIARHARFDRLYFYDTDRPLHVSVGPDESRCVVWMQSTGVRRRIPRVVDADDLPSG